MLEPELVKQLQQVKQYQTRWDRKFLNHLYLQKEPFTEEQERLLSIVLDAVVKRSQDNNVVTDIPDSHIAVFEKYLPQLPTNVQQHIIQLRDFQGYSVTKKQQWVLDLIQEQVKLIHNNTKNKS